MSAAPKTVRVSIRRTSPAEDVEPAWTTIEDVPIEPGMSVTNVLFRINELYGVGIGYRVSCHRGICASCIMRVNGKRVLACTQAVNGDLQIEPAFPDRVIKDLVVEQR